jgi:hypothetical protein
VTALAFDPAALGTATEEEQQLISAVSALTNLKELRSSVMPYSAAAQQQALGQLKQLTRLQLNSSKSFSGFSMLSELPELETLIAFKCSIHDPFTHPALMVLEAGRLIASQQWRGKTAEACKIASLTLSNWYDKDDAITDASLQNMPLLPRLGSFSSPATASSFTWQRCCAGRPARWCSSTCTTIMKPFEEAPPRELSCCTELLLHSGCVSRPTLQLLSLCSLPCVRICSLTLSPSQGLDAEADLGWLTVLTGLPELERVTLVVPAVDAATDLHTAVQALLADKGMTVELE